MDNNNGKHFLVALAEDPDLHKKLAATSDEERGIYAQAIEKYYEQHGTLDGADHLLALSEFPGNAQMALDAVEKGLVKTPEQVASEYQAPTTLDNLNSTVNVLKGVNEGHFSVNPLNNDEEIAAAKLASISETIEAMPEETRAAIETDAALQEQLATISNTELTDNAVILSVATDLEQSLQEIQNSTAPVTTPEAPAIAMSNSEILAASDAGEAQLLAEATQPDAPAIAQPIATESPQAEAETYTIESGDTLSKIAAENNTTVAELAELNGIDDVDMIREGATLQLPDIIDSNQPMLAQGNGDLTQSALATLDTQPAIQIVNPDTGAVNDPSVSPDQAPTMDRTVDYTGPGLG